MPQLLCLAGLDRPRQAAIRKFNTDQLSIPLEKRQRGAGIEQCSQLGRKKYNTKQLKVSNVCYIF